MEIIYQDDIRTIKADTDKGIISTKSKGRESIEQAITPQSYTTSVIPRELHKPIINTGSKVEDKIAFYSHKGTTPIIFPKETKSDIDSAINEYNVKRDAYINSPMAKDRNYITTLYNKADSIARSGREDNVSMPMQLRAKADARLKEWRDKYPEEARKEDARQLIAQAEKQESLAKGALVYDADGSISSEEQTKRHDEFMDKAKEYRKQADALLGKTEKQDKPPLPKPDYISKSELKKIHETRPDNAQKIDERMFAEKTVTNLKTNKGQRRARAWTKRPGRYDIKGIDTPRIITKK